MAVRYLPVYPGFYHFRYPIELEQDGRRWTLEFHWNARDEHDGTAHGAWYMDIADSTGTYLLRGIRLALGTDILAQYRYMASLPPGKFHLVDTSGTGAMPTAADLGGRVVLQYEEGVA